MMLKRSEKQVNFKMTFGMIDDYAIPNKEA